MSEVSIIVPVYKVAEYLNRCVDSILMQTHSDFELILVDDGSPDNCGAICDQYAEKDSRIHVIHQKNGGLSVARNAGIDWVFANSDSQWLTFIDSDDWIHPQMLESLLDGVNSYSTDVAVCGYMETGTAVESTRIFGVHYELWNPEEFYLKHNTNAVIACGKLYRRKCFSDIRYPPGKIHEDEFTTYKILFAQKTVAVTALPLYFYFRNEEGITKSAWTPKRLDAVAALKEQASFFKDNNFYGALDFAAVYCVEKICQQKAMINQSQLPAREKKAYIAEMNIELSDMVRRYLSVYIQRRNLDIFCEILPIIRPIFKFAHVIRTVIK